MCPGLTFLRLILMPNSNLRCISIACRFKGVAGSHSIVSVTIEELAGRTFPTTIRKGKGEQLSPGRGLEYIIYLQPVESEATEAPDMHSGDNLT
jgi:hypothetical protein